MGTGRQIETPLPKSPQVSEHGPKSETETAIRPEAPIAHRWGAVIQGTIVANTGADGT